MLQDFDFSHNFGQVVNMDTIFDDAEWNIPFTDNLIASSPTAGFFDTTFDVMENGE